jgi:hypothetical protein
MEEEVVSLIQWFSRESTICQTSMRSPLEARVSKLATLKGRLTEWNFNAAGSAARQETGVLFNFVKTYHSERLQSAMQWYSQACFRKTISVASVILTWVQSGSRL